MNKYFMEAQYSGLHHMPKVKPYVGPIPHELIGFHRARALKSPSDAFVHFYLYDKNFNCIKNDLTRYLSMFSKHPGVIAPDFSVYTDMPKPLVMANSFYNKEIAAILQQHGIAVIPNISWSRSWSYEFCFEGWPKESVIAINSTGLRKDRFAKRLWLQGYEQALKTLEPLHILRYGAIQEGELQDMSPYYPNDNHKSAGHGW